MLKKFGVNYINQDLFLNEFTKGVSVHIDDLITQMKRRIASAYSSGESDVNKGIGFSSLESVKSQDFFQKISRKIQQHAKSIDRADLLAKFREFDPADTGLIKACYLV